MALVEQASEEDVLKGKQSIRSQALGNQNSESETSLDGDDDTLSSVDEKDLENLTGPVNLSTSVQLVAPAMVVKGTLSITASELYFEVDEDEPGFRAIDPKFWSGWPGSSRCRSLKVFSTDRHFFLQPAMSSRFSASLNCSTQASLSAELCLPVSE
ncbi:Lipopolysaccharide-responsive and beige-like anchor protein [Liparis tanakae]|uniref:Lipopolysaccharide-responsive and beige-like anchor protein n=1 Tax=Liparis tanakae TaxID=230148 RepID=A0A4Z2JHB4_9TELE|nr:Lipopolysaccharide-responsive and beige-like anchor protein [Liparis tanakae]